MLLPLLYPLCLSLIFPFPSYCLAISSTSMSSHAPAGCPQPFSKAYLLNAQKLLLFVSDCMTAPALCSPTQNNQPCWIGSVNCRQLSHTFVQTLPPPLRWIAWSLLLACKLVNLVLIHGSWVRSRAVAAARLGAEIC